MVLKRKYINFIYLTCFIFICLSGLGYDKCAVYAQQTSAGQSLQLANADDSIIVGQKGDVISLNPLLASDSASSTVYNRIFNKLLKYDEKMQIECDLAKKYEVYLEQYLTIDTVEVSDTAVIEIQNEIARALEKNPFPDKLKEFDFKNLKYEIKKINHSLNTIFVKSSSFNISLIGLFQDKIKGRFNIQKIDYKPVFLIELKPQVQWHDGTAFTADDVIFTIETIQNNKKISAYGRYNIGSIENIEKIGPYSIKIIFAHISPRIFETLQVPILPKHLLNNQDILNARFNMSPVGTGPFKFVEHAYDDYIILERNNSYFDKIPDIHKIVFRIIPSESIMFLELLQGNLDIMQLKPDQFVKFTQTPEFEKRFNKINYPENEYTYIGWNLKKPFFEDENVRTALGYAIDKNALIEKNLYNLGQICNGPFSPKSWAANPEIKNLSYDVEKARALLKHSGWNDNDGDGIIEKKFKIKPFFGYDETEEVLPFSFKLIINAGNKDRELCAKFISENLKKVGIDVKVDILDWKDFIKIIDNTDFDAFILTWSLSQDPDISSIWHSSQIPDPARGNYGLNSVSYNNVEVDRLLDEAKLTLEQSERAPRYHKIHEIIMKQQPYTFLFIADTLYAVSKKLKNVKPHWQLGIFYNIEKWSLIPDENRN